MDSQEMQRVYGDSHTLDRPGVDEPTVRTAQSRRARPAHPLDDPAVVDAAMRQGWGN